MIKKEWDYRGDATDLVKFLMGRGGCGYDAVMRALRLRDVKCNGKRLKNSVRIVSGDRIEIFLKDGEDVSVRVLYSDENVIVADKPRCLDTYEAAEKLSSEFGSVFAVHRLDRNTTGVMIFARTQDAKTELENCFREGGTEKIYRAVLVGTLAPDEATLVAYLTKDADRAEVKVFDRPVAGAKRIVTAYRVLAHRDGLTDAEVRLLTGRTHQIRAHFAHIGFPVLGDMKYGNAEENRARGKRFQELRCVSLRVSPSGNLSYLSDYMFRAD